MNSRKALLVAVLAIFGTALAAELSGVVHHGAQAPPLEARAGSPDGAAPPAATPGFGASPAQLRIGIMGAFVIVCFYAVLRLRGTV